MLNKGDWVLDDKSNEWRVHGSTKGARVLLERYANGMVRRSWKVAKWLTKLDPAMYPILNMTHDIDNEDHYRDPRMPIFATRDDYVE